MRMIDREDQECIQRGQVAESLIRSVGWQLLEEELDLIDERCLSELLESTSTDQGVLLGQRIYLQVVRQIRKELRVRIEEHINLKDELLANLKAEGVESPDPITNMDIHDAEPAPEDSFTY